jgi:rubrerythrin
MATTLFVTGNETTIRNLVAAYQGEMNTRARYRSFAVRADEDGYYGIGSLFRAAARAEEIHASNQARVIRQLGGEAMAVIELENVGSTLDNLKTALAGEENEISSIYPAFIEEATTHINATAVRSFVWALEAERTHAGLYSDAIRLVGNERVDSWIGEARDFYVCPVCASTTEHNNSDNCSICNYPSERMEAIR